MKKVTIYSIGRKEQTLMGGYVKFYEQRVFNPNLPFQEIAETSEFVQHMLPVHAYQDGDVRHYFAMEPALAEMLEAPARHEANAWRTKYHDAFSRALVLRARIDSVNQLPLWQRLWIAATRSI